MVTIDEAELRRLDLNLLVVFWVLMREESATRTAARCRMSQAAVSAALGRLRKAVGDPLFVRAPHGLSPTPRARELAAAVGPALLTIEQAMLGGDRFDPSATRRTFVVGMSDDLELALAPGLLCSVAGSEGLSVIVRQTNRQAAALMLDRGEIELAVAASPAVSARQRHQELFSGGYICLFDPEQIEVGPRVSEEDYLAHGHVLVSMDGRRGVVDDVLEPRGLRRRVVTATTHFAALPALLMAAPVLATLPTHAARVLAATTRLRTSELPLPFPRFDVSMLWPAAVSHDVGHLWLREQVIALAQRADR